MPASILLPVKLIFHFIFIVKTFVEQKTMATFETKLQTWLRCPVCQYTVRNPKPLECFHTFCEGCVGQSTQIMQKEKEGVKCPVCMAFTDQIKIKTNALVNEMLQVYQGISKLKLWLMQSVKHFFPWRSSWYLVSSYLSLLNDSARSQITFMQLWHRNMYIFKIKAQCFLFKQLIINYALTWFIFWTN